MRAQTELRRPGSGLTRLARALRLVLAGLTACISMCLRVGPASAADAPAIVIQYLERRIERPTPLNNEEAIPDDEGRSGAELALAEANATGRFLGLRFTLTTTIVEPGQDMRAAFAVLDAPRFVVVNAPADDVLALADLESARQTTFLNAGAPDTRLRDGDCRANLLHVLPSRAMLADALMQFLTFKRWGRILLLSGPNPEDALYAEALKRSARKFGTKVVSETHFDAHGADIRDSALREFAVVTRGPEHDVVAVADERGEFGASVVYNTASARPVVGTQGLTPVTWGRPVEAWAAVQLQGRFRKRAGRPMRPLDYAAWLGVHTVEAAAVQARSGDPDTVRAQIFAPNFEVGGFKGRPLSFRAWNGQLRQPVFLLWPGAVVAAAPLEGFLHQRTDLDTLGLDQPESACRAMKGQR
jgi:ABC transporter substrate binding protein (PQQ-dependent alcohol dehydrogenase system)